MMKYFALFLTSLSALAQGQSMEARDILDQVAVTYASLQSIEMRMQSTRTDHVAGKPDRTLRGTAHINAQFPEKIRIETGSDVQDGTIVRSEGVTLTVSNGTKFWRYQAKANEYFESASAFVNVPGKPGAFGKMTIPEYVRGMVTALVHGPPKATQPTRLPDEIIEIGQKPLPCFLIETKGPRVGQTSRYWVDKARFLLVREDSEVVAGPNSSHIQSVFDFVQLNLPVEETIFELNHHPARV